MRCAPTCFDTCRLQKACLQMLLSYEGRIRFCLSEDRLAAPLSLCSLKVAGLCVLPDECCPQTSVRIALQLNCCIVDSMGHHCVKDSEICFTIPGSYAQARCSRFDAAIRLIHACCDAPGGFHICAQIRLTQMSESSGSDRCCEQNCFHGLPLYPQLRMRRRIKPLENTF